MADEQKNSDSYQLKDLEKKDDEPNEESPLKPKETEAETAAGDSADLKDNEKAIIAANESEKKDTKATNKLVNHPKAKLILAITGAVLLVLLLLIVAVVVVITSRRGTFEEDKTWRYLHLIPRPNGAQNLITFRSGELPLEGRVWPELTAHLKQVVTSYERFNSTTVRECFIGERRHDDNDNSVCLFNIHTIDPECTGGNFGYDKGKPCVFIQFNNISNWIPEPYSATDQWTGKDIPQDINMFARSTLAFIECKGNSPIDTENMGRIEYTPTQGFPLQYFPYTGHPHYMPPLVAIRFLNPKTSIAIGITCKLWDKNLTYSEDSEPSAVLPFNLLIE